MYTYIRIVHIYTYIYLCACACVCIYTSPSQATNRGEFENGPFLARTERQKRLCTMIASSVARLLLRHILLLLLLLLLPLHDCIVSPHTIPAFHVGVEDRRTVAGQFYYPGISGFRGTPAFHVGDG